MNDEGQYPRWLNGHGCIFGQNLGAKVEELEGSMDKFGKKLDKILLALVIAAVGLASSAVMLGLNLAIR